MAKKSSIVTIKYIENSEYFGPVDDNDLILDIYKVVRVEGEKPRLIIRPMFGDNRPQVKVVQAGENISEGEFNALENSGIIVDYFFDFRD